MSNESAIFSNDYLQRFGGIARLYGLKNLQKIHQAHITIVGIGGVGSWAAESLARSGVGKIKLIDLDDICITNTNRQIHAHTQSIGQMKVEAMATRLKTINPEIKIEESLAFYTEKNAEKLISPEKTNLVIDAIDSTRPKLHLLSYCRKNKIPIVCSGGAGGRIDATKIQIDDLAKTHGDALLSSIRTKLRTDHGFPKSQEGKKLKKFKIPTIFSTEAPRFPTCDGEISLDKSQLSPPLINCNSGYGAITHITAIFGLMLAQLALEEITKN